MRKPSETSYQFRIFSQQIQQKACFRQRQDLFYVKYEEIKCIMFIFKGNSTIYWFYICLNSSFYENYWKLDQVQLSHNQRKLLWLWLLLLFLLSFSLLMTKTLTLKFGQNCVNDYLNYFHSFNFVVVVVFVLFLLML